MTAEGDDTKARLLTEARDLYLEQGFARFSLREVARRVGLSPAAVYRHFDGKEALLREVCAAGFRTFSSYLLRALSAPTPRERLGRAATMYRRFGLENPHDYRVIYMGEAEGLTPPAPSNGAPPEPTFQFLVDRVRECIDARVLKKGDATKIAAIIWAQVHGLVSLRLSGHLARAGSDAEFSDFYEYATDRLIAGLAP
jgi:AcrR family transcriptional regulator